MRCPKCGFISFDHLDFCRKCKKPLGSVAVMLHGSVHDCHAPVFLRFSQHKNEENEVDEVELERLDDPLINVIEEVEIEAPDLDAMRKLDPVSAQSARPSDSSTSVPAVAVATVPEVPEEDAEKGAAVAQTLSPPLVPPAAATFSGGAKVTSAPVRPEKQPAVSTPLQESMELPPDLADISDLAPPGRDVEFTEVEGENDLDLNLDLDLGFDLRDLQNMKEDTASPDVKPEPAVAAPRKNPVGAVDMDADLNFELDLGGLSLHDYDNGRK